MTDLEEIFLDFARAKFVLKILKGKRKNVGKLTALDLMEAEDFVRHTQQSEEQK